VTTRGAVVALALALTAAGLTGCSHPHRQASAPAAAPAEVDTPDCDDDDWNKHEVPDCGFIYQGAFYPWEWAVRGMREAPHGWKAKTEQADVIKRLKAATRPGRTQPPATRKVLPAPTVAVKAPPPAVAATRPVAKVATPGRTTRRK
jgi:hypothetical protein